MKAILSSVTISLGLCLIACHSPQPGEHATASDLAAIADFNQRYLRAINDGDIKALGDLTTDDHVLLAPNARPLAGKTANLDAMRRAFEQFKIDESWEPVETEVSGDWAWQRGNYQVVATPKAGGTARSVTGSFLRIYQRQDDGTWRMTRDMFNSDQRPVTN